MAEQPGGELAAAAQRVGQGGVVVSGHDLADAAAQGRAERRDVHAGAEQDDAELGAVEPGCLGELAGLLEGDVRADDDLLDAGVVVQDPRHHGGGVEGLGVGAEGEAVALQCVRSGVPEDVHAQPPNTFVSVVSSLGLTFTSEPRRPA